MHFIIGLAALAGLIAFAFGERAAATFVTVVLIGIAAGFTLITFLIVTDRI